MDNKVYAIAHNIKAVTDYISRKNDRPLKEARALVIDMCAGKLEWPTFLRVPYVTITPQLLSHTS